MKRHYSPDQDNFLIIDVGPETAQWKYLSFRGAKLPPGRVLEGNSGSDEIAIVPLHGRARIAFNNNSHELRRDDLFQQLADVVYLPPRTSYTIESFDGFEVAIGGAPATGRLPARIIRKEEIPTGVRGGANAARGVSALLDSDELTERLTVYEIHTPSGNWSSFSPHRHDTRDNSSYHEETYYYRLRPPEGFAIQRLYMRDTDLDVAIPVHDGDLVPIYEGYHPVVKAPGTNAYYLNVRQVIFCGSDSGIRVRVADHCLGRHRRNQPNGRSGRSRRNGCRHDSDRSVTQRARDHERQPILSAGDHCSSRRI
jgi:5-deoxy-glucuronate isomerase